MKTALVIFNGIRFPYYLVDHVIAWANKNSAGLHALFIKAKHREKEGYIFPSDMDAAEALADTEDAEHDDVFIIRSQMKLLEDMAKGKNIPYQSAMLNAPSLKDILEITKETDILFMDAGDTESGILSVTSFTINDLVKKSHCPVETIKAEI